MKIYRIEAANGEGVFESGLVARIVDNIDLSMAAPDSPYRHPCPHEDVPGWASHKERWDFYCGFSSLDQLIKWFDSEQVRVMMNIFNAVMKVYDCHDSDVLVGGHQVMFRKQFAKLVSEHNVPVIETGGPL